MCQREMPKYKCHKVVHALQVDSVHVHTVHLAGGESINGATIEWRDPGYAKKRVSAEWYEKHRPRPGGYYVVYEDGYTSFSPQKAFEDGYARI